MAQLRHPNVVQYLGACMAPPCLLMEHCSRRSIDFILSNAIMDEKVALAWGLAAGGRHGDRAAAALGNTFLL